MHVINVLSHHVLCAAAMCHGRARGLCSVGLPGTRSRSPAMTSLTHHAAIAIANDHKCTPQLYALLFTASVKGAESRSSA